jgi:hypothetical protein
MIRTLGVFLLGIVVCAFAVSVQADEEKKLEGTITCAKCDLKESEKCHNVIVVKEGDKKVVYWFDAKSKTKQHKEVCTEAKEGTVTGTVAKDGDKMVVTVKTLEFKK